MFVIGATKKLQNELNYPIQDIEKYQHVSDIYKWHANIVTLQNKKCLILFNDATGLNLTLFGLETPQFEHFDSVIKGSLRQLFQLLGIDKSLEEELLKADKEIVYTKTSSRKILGMMTEIKTIIEYTIENKNYDQIDAVEVNEHNNKELIFNSLKHQTPYETFINYINEK
ncbi:DUF6933 domain-containing protein [Halobacillus litoralis]|uniref:DUF6933 domain-containing protein n=1 Tax=Halobacillus litoralis TaxID=45668 RepID=UPI001CFE116D|nr:hypothetical protein [Halobacillus litoralis]